MSWLDIHEAHAELVYRQREQARARNDPPPNSTPLVYDRDFYIDDNGQTVLITKSVAAQALAAILVLFGIRQ